jgi:membrane fusion protein (multidrug efflux system)
MQAIEAGDRVIELRRDHAEEAQPGAPPATESTAEPPRRRKVSRTVLVSALATAAAIGGALWITSRPSAETTDDAYLAADTTSVAPKVRGLVAEVLVRDNQTVRAGDPLVRIDAEEFDAKAASAAADLADAEANLAAARAALVSLSADERLAAAQIAATRTAIRSSAAEAGHANADARRFDALVSTGAIARRDADSYRTAAIGAQQGAAHARAQLAVSQEQADVTSAKRPGLIAAVQQAEAARQRASAALDLALQDQRHTLIRAPVTGTVGNRQARVGDYVQPGSRLLTLVPLHALYVTANFKETQMRDMRAGQPVSIDVDALGGKPLKGHVESFAPGSGSTFALLPFEPGTGNFTKIVQRVPVRIRLDPDQPRLDALRPGLSVTAQVRLSN